MDTSDSPKAPDQRAGRRACEDCNDYSDHRTHDGLSFRPFNDEKGGYHRHIVFCPDFARRVANLEAIVETLPLFDGFPYLITRVVEAMRHIIVLPADRDEPSLRRLAELQVLANRLETCLVLGPERAVFYSADGKAQSEDAAPRGGDFVTCKLQPAEDFENTPELLARQRRLEEFVEANQSTGYMVCDVRTSRRKATPEELESLAGLGPDGIPRGLAACPDCGEYRGLSLGADAAAGWVATAYCRCENHNRCARCGGLLAERRLNGHEFKGGQAWHVPAFGGLSHVCPLGAGSIQ